MTKTLFARWLPALTLAVWSGTLLYFHFSGKLKNLVVPAFHTYALLAAGLLGVMALLIACFKTDVGCCSAAECGHGLSRANTGKLLTFLILILPLTAFSRFAPNEFSARFVSNRGEMDASTLSADAKARAEARLAKAVAAAKPTELDPATLPPLDRTPPQLVLPVQPDPLPQDAPPTLTPETASLPPPPAPQPSATATTAQAPPPGPGKTQPAEAATAPKPPDDFLTRTPDGTIIVEVLDLIYAAQDASLRKDFENKPVELIAQFMPDPKGDGKRYRGVRLFMTCCAADARPVSTIFETEKAPNFPEMTWITIRGKATFPIENGRRIALLQADSVQKTEPPENSFLY
jgi:uncharacterized membrane protein YcgQ (UPF0703/DUF1980 family)